MSETDYELHIQRSLYESLWDDDDLPTFGEDPKEIDKSIAEGMAEARRRRRRRPHQR